MSSSGEEEQRRAKDDDQLGQSEWEAWAKSSERALPPKPSSAERRHSTGRSRSSVRRWLIVVVIVALLAAGVWVAYRYFVVRLVTPTATAKTDANVRTGPGLDFTAVGTLSVGQEVRTVCIDHGWVMLADTFPDKYVYIDFLELQRGVPAC